jgi:hypothetical protein
MLHFSLPEMAAICAMLAWPVIALFAAVFGLGGLRQRARQRRAWRVTVVVATAVLAVDTIVALPIIKAIIRGQVERWQIERDTYRLDAPQTLDGTVFPAGSEIMLSIDAAHRLERGIVRVPTKVLGLDLIDQFSIRHANDGRAYIDVGTLASEATINDMPCGPGPFSRESETQARCMLVRDLPIAGMALRAGTRADIWHSPLGGPPRIEEGTLANSAQLSGLLCAAGPVTYAAYEVRCRLAGDQWVRGFLLAGGRLAALSTDSDGAQSLKEGTFSAPLQVLGVTLPAGTQIDFVGHYGAAELRAGPLPAGAGNTVSFILAADAELEVQGATLLGPVEIEFAHDWLEVAPRELDSHSGTISFAGRRHYLGFLDAARRRWRFDDEIEQPE